MIRRTGTTALVTLSLLAGIGALTPAHAQGLPPGLENLTVPPGIMFGMMGQSGTIPDPTHSNAAALLQRQDVISELLISLNQRRAIEDLKTKSAQELQGKVQEATKSAFQGIASVPQDQLQQHIQELMNGFATTFSTVQGDADKHTEDVLHPDQIKRLHELDLQWRGPLAMTDPKVAAIVALTPAQKLKVDEQVQVLAALEQKTMMKTVMEMTANITAGGRPDAAGVEDQQKKLYASMHTPEFDKASKAANDAVLALLDPTEAAAWAKAQGAPFKFRKPML